MTTSGNSTHFYLASGSSARKRLLKEGGYRFSTISHGVEEPAPHGGPIAFARQVAEMKARSASKKVDEVVVAADTVVAYRGVIYGKPADRSEAREMLSLFSGTKHQVISGLALARQGEILVVEGVVSLVEMEVLSPDQLDRQMNVEDILDKSGAIDIEEDDFVRVVEGSFSNVVGLPMERFEVLYGKYIAE